MSKNDEELSEELDETEEEELDEPEEPEAETAPEPEPEPPPRKGRGGGRKGAPPKTNRNADPRVATDSNEAWPREADELWAFLVAKHLPRVHRTPYDVRIRLVQVDPPITTADNQVAIASFSGSAVVGTPEAPTGFALTDYIIGYHERNPSSRGPVRYRCDFCWSQNGQKFCRGEMTLAPMAQIRAMRDVEDQRRIRAGEQPLPRSWGDAPGFGAPNRGGFVPPPMGYGSVPPPSDQTPQVLHMMHDMWREMWRANQEQRPPNIPQGMGAPPPPPPAPTVTEIVAATLEALDARERLRGVGSAASAPAAVAAPTQQVAQIKTTAEKLSDRIMTTMFDAMAGAFEKGIKQTFAGLGAPAAAEEPDEPDPNAVGLAAPPPPPEDPLPWTATKVSDDVKWGDGRHVMYAADRETGGFDVKGFLFSNPTIAETGMGVVDKLATAGAEVIRRIGTNASAGMKPANGAAAALPAVGVAAPAQAPASPAPPPPAAPQEDDWRK